MPGGCATKVNAKPARPVLFAATIAAAAATACSEDTCGAPADRGSRIRELSTKLDELKRQVTRAPKRQWAAPIFVHGPGRGGTHCFDNNPPVFLSDSEAKDIIDHELGQAGIVVDRHDVSPKSVCMKRLFDRSVFLKAGLVDFDGSIEPAKASFGFDGVSTKANLAYHYVSRDKFGFLVAEPPIGVGMMSYNVRNLAEHIRDVLSERSDFVTAVFYDPITDGGLKFDFPEPGVRLPIDFWAQRKREEERKAEALRFARVYAVEDLRAQVRDFVEWVRRQRRP